MVSKTTKNFIFGGVAILVLGMIFGVIDPSQLNLPSFSVGTAGATATVATTQTSVAGAQFSSDSVLLRAYEKYSESPTNANGGNILLFAKGTDPKDPSATALATLTIGTAYTTGDVACGREYKIVYNNASEAYATDLGDSVLVNCDTEYNKQNGDSLVDLTAKYGFKRAEVATLADIFDETNTELFNANVNTTATANASINLAGLEIGCSNDDSAARPNCPADAVIIYDVSQGDGTWSVDMTLAAGGSQAELRDPVITFIFEAGNEPEGNEVTAMTWALRTGTDLQVPATTNWPNVWSNQENVKLKNPMLAGDSGTYRQTVTYNEANVAAADDWQVCFDDLASKGATLGRDARLNVGAARDCIDFDAQA